MRVLIAGDIVGSPGRRAFAQGVARLRREHELDAVIVNAENAAGGRGVTLALAEELFGNGADALTMGDHVWDQKDLVKDIAIEPRILRPENLPPGNPGCGWITCRTPKGPLTVVNLMGRVFMPPTADCPFRAADALFKRLVNTGPIVVDFHAEATSEKIGMGWFLDGRAAAVVGSHTHVQTADDRVLPGGTAYITDLGMTGPRRSILGREVAPVLKRFVTGLPQKFDVADEDIVMEGVLLDLDERSGLARSIQRVREEIG